MRAMRVSLPPRHHAEWEKWQLCIVIFKQHGAMKPWEFSSEVLYATEQETDIHGIAFGQHLIDGKVEGRSVSDMKIKSGMGFDASVCNFPSRYQIVRSKMDSASCSISLGGCRLESQWTMTLGKTVELRLLVPGLERPPG